MTRHWGFDDEPEPEVPITSTLVPSGAHLRRMAKVERERQHEVEAARVVRGNTTQRRIGERQTRTSLPGAVAAAQTHPTVSPTTDAPNETSAVLEALRWLVEAESTRDSARIFAGSLLDAAEHYGGLTERQFNAAKGMILDDNNAAIGGPIDVHAVQREVWARAPRRSRFRPERDTETANLTAVVKRETEKGIQLVYQHPTRKNEDGSPEVTTEWFPKSSIARDEENDQFVVAGWIAKQKGLTSE